MNNDSYACGTYPTLTPILILLGVAAAVGHEHRSPQCWHLMVSAKMNTDPWRHCNIKIQVKIPD
jgi:hypothetical protein